MRKIHIIGIGGIGSSSLARHLKEKKFIVSGSDQVASAQTERLAEEGIHVTIGQKKENIPKDCDLIIYSPAIPPENPELQETASRKIKKMSYPEALGFFFKDTKNICVAGTHGKTTVTGMIGKMLIEGKKDPTVIIGANIQEWEGKNYHHGKSDYAVIESCEYKESFLNLQPLIVVLTNVDLDHLDSYANKDAYDQAFEKFIQKIPKQGTLIYHEDDESSRKIAEKVHCKKIPVSKKFHTELQVPGKHNQKNAALVDALGKLLEIPEDKRRVALADFSGTMRRFEYKGNFKYAGAKTKVYDDYGHHPTEIRATLQAAREKFPKEKILVIFQPHQFSRTKYFLEDFKTCFADADAVLIPSIYEARDTEKDKHEMSREILAEKIRETGKKVYTEDRERQTKEIASSYDVVITIGAGNVWKIGETLILTPRLKEIHGVIYGLLGAAIGSLWPVLVHRIVQEVPPFTFTALANVVTVFAFFFYSLIRGNLPELKNKAAYKYFLLIGLTSVVIPPLLIAIGSQYTSGTNTSMLLLTELIYSMILTHFIGERTTLLKLCGATSVLIGAALITYRGSWQLNIGDVMIMLAPLTYPFSSFYSKKALNHVSAETLLLARYTLGSIFLLILMLIFEQNVDYKEVIQNHWIILLFFGGFILGVGKMVNYEAFRRLDISKFVSIMMTYPFFSILTLVVLFNEKISTLQSIGIAVMMLGVLFTLKRNSVHPKNTKYAIH